MTVKNQFTKTVTGFKDTRIVEAREQGDEPIPETVYQTRSRYRSSNMVSFTGGSEEAANALRKELNADPKYSDISGYAQTDLDDPSKPLTWTVTATESTLSEWGDWA